MNIALAPEELEPFRQQRKIRDEMAQRMGIATFEYERAKQSFGMAIDQSLREEKQLGEELARKHGIDGGTRCRVDLQTGQLVTE